MRKADPVVFVRTWLLMTYQSVCRTFTTTFQNAFRPSSKVLLTSKIPRQTLNITQIYYTLSVSFFFCHLGSLEQVEAVMDEVEKYMMSRLYKEVFCPETTDDEKKDLAIQKRIRSGLVKKQRKIPLLLKQMHLRVALLLWFQRTSLGHH